jgi:hypothetical protein
LPTPATRCVAAARSPSSTRAANQADAQKLFEANLQQVLNPCVYQNVYLTNRDYFLTG